LVVFIVQRLDWRRFSDVDRGPHHRESGVSGFDDTSHNKDAARRRMLDRGKSVGSFSTLSSTSSITTEANITDSLLVGTEDDDVSGVFDTRRRWMTMEHDTDYPQHQEAECECHYYYPHDAMLYTAHVGDCRAVMLGSAPPRTIKVPPDGDSSLSLDHADISEDDSCSESIADEISSSEHDSDSSGDMLEDDDHFIATGTTGLGTHALGFVRRTSKRQRRNEKSVIEQPFVPLPPLNRQDSSSEESAVESDDSASTTSQEPIPLVVGRPPLAFNNHSEEEKMSETEDEDELKEIRSVRSGSPTQMDRLPSPTQLVADPVHPPPMPLSLLMRPIDLTTDHSAYNPAEVNAVLRRCHNAPKAISSASSGGIKRVAGSLAVTRALGDAYLKTPRLSFFPYKRHAPYITARPEVNCRVLTKGADRILTLASDGVWERASGDDVLRWVRNYYNSRIAGMEELHFYDVEDKQHDAVYGDSQRINRLAKDGEILGSSNKLSTVLSVGGSSNSGDRSSEEDASKDPRKSASLPSPTVVDARKTTCDDDAATLARDFGDKLENNDANSTSQTLATNITASEVSTPVKTLKRKHSTIAKHSDTASVDDSVSTRSTASSQGLGVGVGVTKTTLRRHRRSLSTPTVADVIVRKVLNKVRKTRNISSLRMLMSLPKGRARRSKHDDITATVVDLSVSSVECPLVCGLYFSSACDR
jgi:serine/threonine protein phosphatase PrpC